MLICSASLGEGWRPLFTCSHGLLILSGASRPRVATAYLGGQGLAVWILGASGAAGSDSRWWASAKAVASPRRRHVRAGVEGRSGPRVGFPSRAPISCRPGTSAECTGLVMLYIVSMLRGGAGGYGSGSGRSQAAGRKLSRVPPRADATLVQMSRSCRCYPCRCHPRADATRAQMPPLRRCYPRAAGATDHASRHVSFLPLISQLPEKPDPVTAPAALLLGITSRSSPFSPTPLAEYREIPSASADRLGQSSARYGETPVIGDVC